MKILEEKDNILLNRKEVKIIVDAEKNPNFADMTKEVAGHFKVDEKLVHVNKIKGKFGRDTFLINAFVYKTVEEKEKQNKVKEKKK
jgi:ribosomal protein S24E